MIKHQFRFDQISDHKHIYFNGKVSTKLVVQGAKKILTSCLRKLDGWFFLKFCFRRDYPEQF